MKKVLFYSHTGKVSGAENVLLMVIERIDRSRFSPSAVCPADGTLAQEIGEFGVPVKTIDPLEARFTWHIRLLFRYFVSFVSTYKQLRSEISRVDPDLIHANSIRAGLVATAATIGTRIPVFWHLQDELPRHPLSSAIRLLVAASSRVRLIAASRATADSFRGRLLEFFRDRTPTRIVHNAIELDKFSGDPRYRDEIREEIGVPPSEFVIGVVGQITPRKGQLELIRSFANSQSRMPSSTLLIVGAPMFNRDDVYLEELRSTTAELGLSNCVRFTGKRTDIVKIMQALDVLVVNSRSEAFVIVALEAMACGTPVIATDVGGIREMIEHKVSGWIVPFGDEPALSKALTVLSHDPDLRSRLSVAGKKVVTKHFHADKFIEDIERFFGQTQNVSEDKPSLVLAEQ